MKIVELINKLLVISQKHGNIEVYVPSAEIYGIIDVAEHVDIEDGDVVIS